MGTRSPAIEHQKKIDRILCENQNGGISANIVAVIPLFHDQRPGQTERRYPSRRGQNSGKPFNLDIDIKHCVTNAGPENTQDCPTGAQTDVRPSDVVLRDTPCLEGGDNGFKSRAESFQIWAFILRLVIL